MWLKLLPILLVLCTLTLSACEGGYQVSDIDEVINQQGKPTQGEASRGLKQALNKGIDDAVNQLGATGGFLNDPDYKIFLPPSAQKMEKRLRGMGMDEQVDHVVKQLNKGAEQAVDEAKEVFTQAITEMSVQDALNIVTGGEGSATGYLKQHTQQKLTDRFRPVIDESLNQVGATRNWNDIAEIYNKIPLVEPVETDLNAYVTQQALGAVFNEVRRVENDIRENPVQRTSEVLKKVFGYADSHNGG